jgi:O-antigen/teichoic acid export membrane protein
MGIIIRQSLKYSLINYAAVLVGVFSTLFIYPLNKQVYGLFRFLLDTSNLLVPLVLIGTPALSVKFFPLFKGVKHKEGEFITHLFWLSLIGFAVTIFTIFIFREPIVEYYGRKTERYYLDYLWFIVPFLFANSFFALTKQITTNFSRIVWPSIFESLIKVAFPVLFLSYYWHYINLDSVIIGVAIFLFCVMAMSMWYLFKISSVKLRIPKTKTWDVEKREFYKYAAYFTIGSAGSIIATRIDTFMVGSMINLNQTGIYSIAALIAVNIGIPVNAITAISSPIISKEIAANNWSEVEKIYKKSSITLLLAGCFLFLLVWTNIDDLFGLMPDNNEMSANKMVVLLLASAKLFDMATGVNDSITAYSGHYKVNFYSILLLAVLNISGNLVLIPKYGILGAAISPMIASIVYNLVKLSYIKWAFKMYPFTLQTLKLTVVSVIIYGLLCLLPTFKSHFLNLFLNSAILTIMFVPSIYFLKISDDTNALLDTFLSKFTKILKMR